ncbi:MAG: HD domain-containing protein [Deltaproteobacteria bacterium]|nr:HD domain-containing protein [Deltaproteobacteria bacterium]
MATGEISGEFAAAGAFDPRACGDLTPPVVAATRSLHLVQRSAMRDRSRADQVAALLDLLSDYSPATYDHCRRVAALCHHLALALGCAADEVNAAFFAGLLHDIGKLVSPLAIIEKPAPLTDDEWAVIEYHPSDGHRLIAHLVDDLRVTHAVEHHHERYDGHGYPDCIGTCTRVTAIVAVADAYDAMTHGQCYRPALGREQVLDEFCRGAGSQFAPTVVAALFELIGASRELIDLCGLADPTVAN